MEVVVVIVVVVGIAAVVLRFMGSPGEGRKLPRIVDESIGMWVVREIRHRLSPRPERGAPAGQPRPPHQVRAFDPGMARRLGIKRAGDVAPRRPSPAPGPAPRPADRRVPRPVQLVLMILLAMGVGLLLGAGVGLLAPR